MADELNVRLMDGSNGLSTFPDFHEQSIMVGSTRAIRVQEASAKKRELGVAINIGVFQESNALVLGDVDLTILGLDFGFLLGETSLRGLTSTTVVRVGSSLGDELGISVDELGYQSLARQILERVLRNWIARVGHGRSKR